MTTLAANHPTPTGAHRAQAGLIIFISTLVAQLISLRFGGGLEPGAFADAFLPSALVIAAVTLPCVLVGVSLGTRIGLGAPKLFGLLERRYGVSSQFTDDAKLASICAVLFGALLLAVRYFAVPHLPDEVPAFGHRGAVGGMAVSVGAAIGEEVWFRFGLMTLLIWLCCRITGANPRSRVIAWPVILLVSVGFAAAHLPQLFSYGAGQASAIAATMLGNILVSILYGWLFWSRGLFAAIAAHLVVDIVLHVVPALF